MEPGIIIFLVIFGYLMFNCIGGVTAIELGFTPREMHENTRMSMPLSIFLFIVLHLVFFVMYIFVDLIWFANRKRK